MTVRASIEHLRQAQRAFKQRPEPALSTTINQLVKDIKRKATGMHAERWLGVHWQITAKEGELFVPCTEAGDPPRWLVVGAPVNLADPMLKVYFQQILGSFVPSLDFWTMSHVTARYGYCGRYVSVDRKDYTPWHFNIREQSLEKELRLTYGGPSP